jgi:hypothetical protein
MTHLRAGAGNRDFKKPDFAADASPERGNTVWIAGAGADHDLAGRGRYQSVLDDVLDLIGREHREHDGIALPCDVGN